MGISLLIPLLLVGSASAEKVPEGTPSPSLSLQWEGWGGGKDGKSSLSLLSAEIRKRIEKAKFYPDLARDRGIEGTVELLFTLSANGSLREVKVLHSSGSPVLDQAAIEAVKRVAPYPVMEDWPGTLQLQLSITYRLQK